MTDQRQTLRSAFSKWREAKTRHDTTSDIADAAPDGISVSRGDGTPECMATGLRLQDGCVVDVGRFRRFALPRFSRATAEAGPRYGCIYRWLSSQQFSALAWAKFGIATERRNITTELIVMLDQISPAANRVPDVHRTSQLNEKQSSL